MGDFQKLGIKAEILHFWESPMDRMKWCVLFVNGFPYLACEEDA